MTLPRRGWIFLFVLVVIGLVVVATRGGEEPEKASACGDEPPRPGSGHWVCTFADDFDGDHLDRSKWTVTTSQESTFRNGPECYVDDPDTVSVADGVLRLSTIHVPQPVACPWGSGAGRPAVTPYLSGMVSTRDKFAQTYGRFEIRAAFPQVSARGVGSAVWMWPQDQVHGRGGASGEIDLVEHYSGSTPDMGMATVKYLPRFSEKPPQTGCRIDEPGDFHVYAVTWSARLITITYDGQVCLAAQWDPAPPLRAPEPFDHAFNIALTESLGIGSTALQPWLVTFPQSMKVDYVRAWRYRG